MTFRQKHKENERLLANYQAFLPRCTTYEDWLKLRDEIDRLKAQNEHIGRMSYKATAGEMFSNRLQIASRIGSAQ